MSVRTVTVSVIGVSGKETVKGIQGVGKSVLCNRFVRGDFDDFFPEHSSVLSQTDFGGSPVINNDHWLYWGDRSLEYDDSGSRINVRVIEQTELLDDETFEPLAGPSTSDPYPKRASRIRLESRDKLMYIQKEQLGLEAEFPQHVLPDGKCQVDCFIYVFDTNRIEGRSFEGQCNCAASILTHAIKSKKPVIIALTKCDSMFEDYRKSLHNLLNKKDLKGVSFNLVEVSSFMDVNVDEVFMCAVMATIKGKTRLKILPFGEAAKAVCDRKQAAKQSYARLLHGVLPIDSWPIQRLSWSSLMLKLDIDRHPDYCNFIRVFGRTAARKVYDQHVNEARDHWMAARLHALVPSLPTVFSSLLIRSEVPDMTWSQAKHCIISHGLFDEYFQPLGQLGKQLDPLSPDVLYDEKRGDQRIPAEILLRQEARIAFEKFQQAVEAESRKERLEEDFEFLLAETSHVTPGKPLQDVCGFLQGYGTYEALAPGQASMIYDRFQNDLVQKAEAEFSECLLENVELILDVVRAHRERERDDIYGHHSFALSTREMDYLKDRLQEDIRYRQLSCLFELRDNMIHQFASFLYSPVIRHCPAKARCSDVVVHEAMQHFFHRRKFSAASGQSDVHTVDITVHGEISLVAQFITDMNVLLRNDCYVSSCGPVNIRCFGAEECPLEVTRQPRTQLYLLDSPQSIEEARNLSNVHGSQSMLSLLPPVYVLVCDPGHYDLLPFLHQQGALVADATGGIFIGAGTAESDKDSHWSRSSDCSSIFGRDQLLRVCDTVCSSQLDRRHCDMRVQASLLCGDPFSVEALLTAMFPMQLDEMKAVVNPSLISAGIVPIDAFLPSSGRLNRIDVNLGSYHSWLSGRPAGTIHGHIVVYSARRPASLAHARAAVARVLDEGFRTVSGKAILLVAVADVQENHNDEETNLLLTEGCDLATSIGASYLTISSSDSSSDCSPSSHTRTFMEFFDRLKGMVPQCNADSLDRERLSTKRESDGYATLSDFKHLHQPPSLSGASGKEADRKDSAATSGQTPSQHSQRISQSAATLRSNSSSTSCESTLSDRLLSPFSHRAESAASSSAVPGMRPSSSTGAMSTSYIVAPRPRRRVAPTVASLRLPPLRQAEVISSVTAPLATPETIELAPEYSVVQDALTDDDHIYATLDFACPSACSSASNKDDAKSQSGSERSDSSATKEKKRPLRSRMFSSSHSSSTEPSSSPSINGTVPGSQPSSAVASPSSLATSSPRNNKNNRRAVTSAPSRSTAPLLSVPPDSPTSRLPSLLSPSLLRRTLPVVQPATKRPDIAPKPAYLRPQQMPSRSITLDVISKEVLAKARAAPAKIDRPGLRQSLSAESLAELLKEKKKKTKEFGGSRFVRKVATSFRFKKPVAEKDERGDSIREEETQTALDSRMLAICQPHQQGSRSLPQSPHTDRRTTKKYGTGGGASTEKVSSAFSWLPSRSPKRNTKTVASEANQGIISPTDTIESLCETIGGIPVFLAKCVDFIENEGGLEMEGLYRVPGNQAQLVELEKAYRDNGDLNLSDMNMPVHVVATAVKNFFSCLPDPLIPYEQHIDVLACMSRDESEVCNALRSVFQHIPPANLKVLSYFTCHLHKVASSPATAMDIVNLSKVWFPTFFRPKFENFLEMSTGMAKFQQTMEAILTHSQEIFRF